MPVDESFHFYCVSQNNFIALLKLRFTDIYVEIMHVKKFENWFPFVGGNLGDTHYRIVIRLIVW